MSFQDIRAELMENFSSVHCVVYDYVPPMISTPAIFLFPDDPYIEPYSIKNLTTVKLNYRLIAAVAMNDNRAALGNLETLCASIMGAIPAGYQVSAWDKPSLDQVGDANLLVSTITLTIAADIGEN